MAVQSHRGLVDAEPVHACEPMVFSLTFAAQHASTKVLANGMRFCLVQIPWAGLQHKLTGLIWRTAPGWKQPSGVICLKGEQTTRTLDQLPPHGLDPAGLVVRSGFPFFYKNQRFESTNSGLPANSFITVLEAFSILSRELI